MFFDAAPLSILLLLPLASAQPTTNPRKFSSFSISQSPWRPTQNLTLLSPNSLFAAGFHPLPNNSNLFIFSVWYFNISTDNVVWSANRLHPVNRSAALVITATGQLRLNDASGRNLWPSNNVSAHSNSTQLILRDDGDLIYGTWESFQFPTNTFLPNHTFNGTSIVSNNGKYSFVNSANLTFGTETYWSSGNPFQNFQIDGQIIINNQIPVIPSDFNSTRFRKLVLDDDGNLRIFSFNPNWPRWDVVWQAHVELCQILDTCGPNSVCMSSGSYNSTYCVCAPGFSPNPRGGARQGCHRKLNVSNKPKFLQLDFVNFRGGVKQISLQTPNISVCQADCLKNSSCVGYTFSFDGNGNAHAQCVLQLDILSNGLWSPGMKAAAFVKVDNSETDRSNFTGMMYKLQTTCPVRITLRPPPVNKDNTTRNILIISTIFVAELITGAVFFWAFLKRFVKYRDMARTLGLESLPAGGPKRFNYAELKTATNDFSTCIGRGGFGEVFKGELPDKRVVAVKCLKNVAGGDRDFWAEVTIIARMHHLNLLRLWGFCAEKGWAFEKAFVEEKMKEILDGRIREEYERGGNVCIVNRMVETAMWCLQNQPEKRPSMGKVVKMLEGKLEIPPPEKPSIYFLSQ
uniref:non-specific serine/threonine protein kinase n=1 Tax=Cucumis sativus TaxID=3659 RepID=A0A0A0KSR7_CUCSA